MVLLLSRGSQRPRSLHWEEVCCLKDMELERDLFGWDKWHLTNLFQFTGHCFLLGVSSSIPGRAACKWLLRDPLALGSISSPAQGYFWAPTCFTSYQPARSATESLMLQWFQRTRRVSGRICPCGNNRTCSISLPLPCSWHLQTQLSQPSLGWFYTECLPLYLGKHWFHNWSLW